MRCAIVFVWNLAEPECRIVGLTHKLSRETVPRVSPASGPFLLDAHVEDAPAGHAGALVAHRVLSSSIGTAFSLRDEIRLKQSNAFVNDTGAGCIFHLAL